MKKGRNHTHKESLTVKYLIGSVVLFTTIQITLVALTSMLLLKSAINEQSINWILPAGTSLSAFVSSLFAIKKEGTERFKTASLLTGILIIIVILTSFVLNGSIISTWKCDVCVLIGITVTLLVGRNKNIRKKKIKAHL